MSAPTALPTLAGFPAWAQNDANALLAHLEAEVPDLAEWTLDTEVEVRIAHWTTANKYNSTEIHIVNAAIHLLLAMKSVAAR